MGDHDAPFDEPIDDPLAESLRRSLEPDPTLVPSAERVAAVRRAAERRAAEHDRNQNGPDSLRNAVSSRSLRPLIAAAALIVVGMFAALGLDRGPDGDVEYDGDIAGPGGDGTLRVVEIGIGRLVDLDTSDLAILPTGEYYELWFVGPDDTPDAPNRISAGTFHPDADGRSQVSFTAAVNPELLPTVEITAEPGDGDPRPSGVVVMSATIDR